MKGRHTRVLGWDSQKQPETRIKGHESYRKHVLQGKKKNKKKLYGSGGSRIGKGEKPRKAVHSSSLFPGPGP